MAIGLLVRATIRRRWPAIAALAVITLLACGFVLTAATGARRTQTAWSRLEARTGAPEALVSVRAADVDSARATIAARPDVAGVGAFSWMPAAAKGMPGAEQQGLFAGLGPGFPYEVWRPLIERGRNTDPGRADEVTINQAYADLAQLDVGDPVHLVGPKIDQRATVVGIHRSALDIGPNGGAPSALATPAFMARSVARVIATLEGFDELRPAVAVRFTAGTDVDGALAALARALPPDAGIVAGAALDLDLRDGLNASTTAYAVLAAASALASLLLLSFLVNRMMRVSGEEIALLAALGATRRERAIAVLVPSGAAVVGGVIAAPLLAAAASPFVRTGFAKVADPTVGVWVDGRVLAAGCLALCVALLSIAALNAWRIAGSPEDARRAPLRPSFVSQAVGASPAAVIGACAAFGGIRGSTRRLAWSTLVALSAVLACIVAALAWAASAERLNTETRLQGWSFDAVATASPEGDAPSFEAAGAALRRSPDVERVSRFSQFVLTYGGVDVDFFALTPLRRSVDPIVVAGRMAAGPNEVALGRILMRQHGFAIGDQMELDGPNGTVHTTIVGEVVFPLLGNAGFGTTVLLTPDTMDELGAEALNRGYLINFAAGGSLGAAVEAVGDTLAVAGPSSPPAIIRLQDTAGINTALAVFLGGFAIAVFAFGMVTATQRQRREYAVVRAMGFRRRQVFAAFGWHSVIAVLTSAVIALPIGVAIGRVAWS